MAALESQELRIDRLDKLIVVTVENQTATLRLLQKIDARVQEHSAILKEHTAILEEHAIRMSNLESLVARIFEELVAIKDILASPRGMGFTPEPENKD